MGGNMKIRLFAKFVTVVVGIASSVPAFAVSPPPAKGTQGMVVTSHRLATEIGIDILKKGGNAVDAAVAIGYALAVTLPNAGNIGGGGFMIIRMADGRETMIDFREAAPLAAYRDMYLDKNGNIKKEILSKSWMAAAIPGTVAGLELARAKYGTMPPKPLVSPSIKLAQDGYLLNEWDSVVELGDMLVKAAENDPYVGRFFLKEGKPYKAGDLFKQPAIARSLEVIADQGPQAFYRGWIAEEIIRASKMGGGIFGKADLEQYQAIERKPIRSDYQGFQIISSAPPSSGGIVLCETLNVLEGFPLKQLGFRSAEGVHFLVEALRRSFADRNIELGDPGFVTNPIQNLISKDYAAKLASSIDKNQATPSSRIKGGTPKKEGKETTHYSVVDKQRNAVAVTYSLGRNFGASKIAGEAGFFLNDTMQGFTAKVGTPNVFGLLQGEANAIAPGKRPLSSMTPTVILKDGKVFMVTGSPGGPRIITTTLHTILNVIDYGMNVQEAVDAPRVHHQWMPDIVYVEPNALSPDTKRILEKMGHRFVVQEYKWSLADSIVIDPITGAMQGAHDNRIPSGAAIGY
jgi:gamma-glutamyltranspeptidase/glutathione hydrolase